jgi:hypothetical protein
MWRHILDAVVGTIVVAAIWFGLANLPLPIMAFAYLFPVITGGFNVIVFVVVAVMLLVAAWWRRPGIALAPLLFAALWFTAAVMQRMEIEAREDPKLAERPVPAQLRNVRTLIIESQGTQVCCGLTTLLADGHVDVYVHADHDYDHKVLRSITAYRLGRGDQCGPEDRPRSILLTRAGRTDECIRSETIDAVPDGVVVRMHPFARAYAAIGCCNRGTISLRSGGSETLQATWYWGTRVVLSYLPLSATPGWGEPVPLWSTGGGGPMKFVEIGGPAFRQEELAAAVYGIDWRAPVKPVVVSAPELVRRAAALVRLPGPGDSLPALDIALNVQDQGFVNDELLDVVAAFVHRAGQGLTTTEKVMRFWQRLSDDQKRAFMEKVFTRIEDPAQGYDFNESVLYFHLPPAKFPGVAERGTGIFVNRRDLKPWQYELALRIARPPLRLMLDSLRDDQSEAFVRRAIAFKRVYLGPTDEEREFFSQKLGLVPDQFLKEYLHRTGWHRWPTEKTFSEATREYRRRAAVRIAAIGDEKLRRELQETFRPERPD